MPYSTLLIDLDHTLLDSDASEVAAFEEALAGAGVASPLQHLPAYHDINRALWAAVERHEITPQQLRVTRFERLIDKLRLDADPAAVADAFVRGLGAHGDLYEGTRHVLDQLVDVATLALVTNGLSEVQRTRIERLDLEQYFAAVVISAEVGASKPGTDIYDITFAALGWPAKTTALMVGDSLTSDMQGGVNYGIATCWFNARGAGAPANVRITHEISALGQLPTVVVNHRSSTRR